MARKSRRHRKAATPQPPVRSSSDRDKVIGALMALLAERRFEQIGLAEVAGQAGLKLSQLRAEFGSTLAILAAHIKEIDRVVLAGGDVDMAEEPARGTPFRRADAAIGSPRTPQGSNSLDHALGPKKPGPRRCS